jgi:hypothetical protein
MLRGTVFSKRVPLAAGGEVNNIFQNVFYELGLAHAFGKKVLLLAQSIEDVPFDLRHRRVCLYNYSPKGCKELEKEIVEHIRAILNEIKNSIGSGLPGLWWS